MNRNKEIDNKPIIKAIPKLSSAALDTLRYLESQNKLVASTLLYINRANNSGIKLVKNEQQPLVGQRSNLSIPAQETEQTLLLLDETNLLSKQTTIQPPKPIDSTLQSSKSAADTNNVVLKYPLLTTAAIVCSLGGGGICYLVKSYISKLK